VASSLRSCAILATLTLAGCSVFVPKHEAPPPAGPPAPALLPPLATHAFPFDPKTTGVVGELQVTQARHEDTLADIARRFNLGYDEIRRANPGVDPWLPGEGTRIVLPTQFVLPKAAPEGIVVNLAALRMYYFPKAAKDEPRQVLTFPIGIGKVGWATPEGTTKIVSKRKDPWWTPPASVRKEHAANGDPLPPRVPPGPDNPLGAYAMNLGWPSLLMHGTNKPPGVGMRASHGCIRLYPEDIAAIFDGIPIGTKVTVVNQPLLYRWQDGQLYVQSYPPHLDTEEDTEVAQRGKWDESVANKLFQVAKQHSATIDTTLAEAVVTDAKGLTVPVTKHGLTLETFVASARRVENVLPEGSNWDGKDAPGADDAVKPVADSGVRSLR
jgi:L,D-transpeptidase ErfK/SrfK